MYLNSEIDVLPVAVAGSTSLSSECDASLEVTEVATFSDSVQVITFFIHHAVVFTHYDLCKICRFL